jgi:cytochrome c oxidase cbb3-type subunit 3
LYVILLSLSNIFACVWLLLWARTKRVGGSEGVESVGHEFDGIQELDRPLPRWWLWLFVGSIIFSLIYLVLYPGLGSFRGLLGWTSHGQYDGEVSQAKERYGPIYQKYAAMPIPSLVGDRAAVQMGQRIFANHCATCHGSDAGGGPGFPNLTDNDWLYGGEPDTIKTSILNGRKGMMPPFAPSLGEDGVTDVIAYVRSLSGLETDSSRIEAGKAKFATVCTACHGPEGKGNQALGAPNLTDDIWLYGSSPETIEEGLRKGRAGQMPAHRDILGEEKAHLVAAYVYSLSHEEP